MAEDSQLADTKPLFVAKLHLKIANVQKSAHTVILVRDAQRRVAVTAEPL
jgi:hypothetical protein